MTLLGRSTHALLVVLVATASLLLPAGAASAQATSVAQVATDPQAAQAAPAALAAQAAQAAQAARVAQAGPAKRYEKKALRATNAQRRKHDVHTFRKNRCLVRAARSQARAMADSGSLYHQELGPVLERCGMRMVGENVAMGYRTGRAAVRGWMGSPGHRENILRREYRLIGIGAAKGRDGLWYSAQVFGRR